MLRLKMLIGAAALAMTGSVSSAELPSVGVLMADGRILSSGFEGRWRVISDLGDGRFATHTELGAFKTAEIYDGSDDWRIERSGGSHRLDSPFARRRVRTQAWLARMGWLQQDFGGASRSSMNKRQDGPLSYQVVTATPRGGEPVELWFDAASGDLLKAVQQDWFRKVTTRYSDYRRVDGRRLPFEIASSDGDNEDRIAIDGYRIAAAAPVGSYAAPRQPDDHLVPRAGISVAAEVFPQLTIEASINDRPMHFIFDTGGHSVLTPAAATALGLVAAGGVRSGGSGAGTVSEQFTHVHELRIGDAVLRDQAFSIVDLGYSSVERGDKPALAGLLGLEVVERFITRLDYRAGSLTLLPRDTPIQCASGWLDARFTDDMPTVEATFDGMRAPFTIDTGNNGSIMLYQHWLAERGVADRYAHGVESVSYGAGGPSRNWLSYARSFRTGRGIVGAPMVRTSDDKGGVSMSRSEAGNLGTDTLANYTLTFDYGRSRVCMDYVTGYRRVPFNRAGLRAVKSDPDTVLLTLVNDGGPAAQAGLSKGDKLLFVDGRPASALGGGDLTRAFTRPPGTRVDVQYAHGTESRRTVVVLRDMLPVPAGVKTGLQGS